MPNSKVLQKVLFFLLSHFSLFPECFQGRESLRCFDACVCWGNRAKIGDFVVFFGKQIKIWFYVKTSFTDSQMSTNEIILWIKTFAFAWWHYSIVWNFQNEWSNFVLHSEFHFSFWIFKTCPKLRFLEFQHCIRRSHWILSICVVLVHPYFWLETGISSKRSSLKNTTGFQHFVMYKILYQLKTEF